MYRVLEIEDDAIGPVQCCIDEILGLATGNVKPGAANAIAGRRIWKRKPVGQDASALAKPGAAHGGFNARRDNEGKRTLVLNVDLRMTHAQSFEHFFSLAANGVAIVGFDAGLKVNLNAATIPRFNSHAKVGADVGTSVAGLAHASFGGYGHRGLNLKCRRPLPPVLVRGTDRFPGGARV